MMNDRWLSSFLCTVRCGSVNKAADELFISPQALLQQLNLLEENVGVQLLNRSKNGVTPTLAGREFLAGAQNLLELYNTTLHRCRLVDRAETAIRIPTSTGLVIPKMIEQVCERYQANGAGHLAIQYLPSPVLEENQLNGLFHLEYDMIQHFSVRGYHPKTVHFEPMTKIRCWCIMSHEHPLSRLELITPEDLDRATVGTNSIHLMSELITYAENTDLHTQFIRIPAERYALLEACNSGSVALMNEDVAKTFPYLHAAPLDFDMNTVIGFACRAEMYELYRPFFEAACQIREELYADKMV